jgi:hypothetical protein
MNKKIILKNVISKNLSSIFTNSYYINLQISIIGKKIVITTHKIASRFMEELSYDETIGKFKTIEMQLIYNENFNYHGVQTIFGNYQYETNDRNDRRIKISEFLSILNVETISDIFDVSNIDGYEVVIIIRNPIFKFLSGWVEIIDQILNSIDSFSENEVNHIKNILKEDEIEFSDIENKDIKKIPKSDANKILKSFCKLDNSIISNNSHTKEWCNIVEKMLFYSNFFKSVDNKLDTKEIPSFIKIVDMDEEHDMYKEFRNEYTSLDRVSNLDVLYTFATDPSNIKYLKTLFNKRINLLDLDHNSYLFLKKLSKK